MSQGDPRAGSASSRRQATVLESVEGIRSQARRAQTVKESIPPPGQPETASGPPPRADDTHPFRPILRPSMAVLQVLDDGDEAGESIRIRAETFVIGRLEGDLVIPHDGGISGRHAEISRRFEGGQHRWYLRDLQSTNGTFVRASSGLLRGEQELLLGGLRLRFEPVEPAAPPTGDASGSGRYATTQKWQALASTAQAGEPVASLVELTSEGEGRRHRLADPEHWVGRDPRQCSVVLDHPMVSPKHARFFRDDRGRWHVQNARSLNGLWVRVAEVSLDRGGQFQCGEQRFLIKIL